MARAEAPPDDDDGPEEAPACAKDAADEDAPTRYPSAARSTSPPAARAMKPSRLQHALLDAHEHLRSRVGTTDTSRFPGTAVSQSSPLSSGADESVRDAVQHVVAAIPRAPPTDPLAHDRLLRAVRSELPLSLANPTQRHETDVRCWYAVGNVVGRGTFGRVSSARHRLSGTRVAIKSYFRERGASACCRAPPASARSSSSTTKQPPAADDALDWRRVRREAKVMAALRPHASVVRFVEAFESPTQLHVVMEFVAGEPLGDFLERHGTPTVRADTRRLDEPRARALFAQVCAAVASLHAQHVVHRDVKLENVLVDARGRATLIDLGFSEVERRGAAKRFCGTPAYMAPEVLASTSYDGRCGDVWSLGVLLYVLLCGRFPFQGGTVHQLYASIRAAQCAFDRCVSRAAQALLRSIFAVDAAKRPSARDLLAHPWTIQGAATGVGCSPTAFVWRDDEAATAQICEALAQICGVDTSALVLAVREQRRNGATALVRLVLRAVEKEVEAARVRAPSSADQWARSTFDSVDATRESGASAHRQHLEGLIGLVRASLQQQ